LPPALRRAAIAPPLRRPAIPLTSAALRRPAIVLSAVLNHGVTALKLVAGALAVGTVALAIMNNRDVKPAVLRLRETGCRRVRAGQRRWQ
jgi:hypothetical protein